jgi:hypothetical protein
MPPDPLPPAPPSPGAVAAGLLAAAVLLVAAGHRLGMTATPAAPEPLPACLRVLRCGG